MAVPANFRATATNCHERKSSPPPSPPPPPNHFGWSLYQRVPSVSFLGRQEEQYLMNILKSQRYSHSHARAHTHTHTRTHAHTHTCIHPAVAHQGRVIEVMEDVSVVVTNTHAHTYAHAHAQTRTRTRTRIHSTIAHSGRVMEVLEEVSFTDSLHSEFSIEVALENVSCCATVDTK